MGIDTEYSFHIVICKDILAPYQNYSNSSSITHGECLIFFNFTYIKEKCWFLNIEKSGMENICWNYCHCQMKVGKCQAFRSEVHPEKHFKSVTE